MARIRTIKPDFFQHEPLYDAEHESGLPLRVAFAGLWTIADKAGRFKWRPRQIKLNVLPYDECDFSAVLSALEQHGFVQRYEVSGKVFGCIPSWDKHQHKNVREPDSTIPAPDGSSAAPDPTPDKEGAKQVHAPAEAAGKGREGKGRVEARERALATPGLDLQAFERWESYRGSKRKPLTEHSYELTAKKLASCGSRQMELVETSISNDYQGLFPEKLNGRAHAVESPRRAKAFPS